MIDAAISIVMPAYNGAKHIEASIASVRRQTFVNWELVVVDDGSTDDTADLLEAASAADNRVKWIAQENSGVSVARNTGFAQTGPSAECVIFLDSDDVWEPDTLNVLFEALSAHPECTGAYGLAGYIDTQGRKMDTSVLDQEQGNRKTIRGGIMVGLRETEPTDFAALCINEGARIVTPGQVLLRKRAYELSGGFEPGLRFCEDWDVWLRTTPSGPLAFVNRRVLDYRIHGANSSAQLRGMAAGHLHVRQKLLHNPSLTAEQRVAAREGYRLYYSRKLSAAAQNLRSGRFRHAALELLRSVRARMEYLRAVSAPPIRIPAVAAHVKFGGLRADK